MNLTLNKLSLNIELLITGTVAGNRASQLIFGVDIQGKRFSVFIRYSATARPVEVGESWSFDGQWDTNPKYQNQLIAHSGEPLSVTGDLLHQYIIRHPKLRCGKGGTRVAKTTWGKAITNAHGADNLAELLDNQDKKSIKNLNVGRITHNIEEILLRWGILRSEIEGIKLLGGEFTISLFCFSIFSKALVAWEMET